MNEGHLQLLASPDWWRYLEVDVLPWALAQVDLDGDVLEVGPGPGLTTDLLRSEVPRLVAAEVDADLARDLSSRLAGTNVDVVCVDATATNLPDDSFAAAMCFTMLHHVPSRALQDALFGELHRILRPGGRLVGTDSADSPELRAFHVDDVFVPVEPDTLGPRLVAAGFADVVVETWEAVSRPGEKIRFVATKSQRY